MLDKIDLLILKKQKHGFYKLTNEHKFRNIHILDEEYYGSITCKNSELFLGKIMKAPYDIAYFPFNTLMANTFLFGGVLAKQVKAINSSLYGKKNMPIIKFSIKDDSICNSYVPWESIMNSAVDVYDKIVSVLRKNNDFIETTNERPMLDGSGMNMAMFCMYIYSAIYAKGKRILDIGGGFGYGSFFLSHFAKKVVFVEPSEEVVKLAQKLWSNNRPNLIATKGDVINLGYKPETFDVVIFLDVVEHLSDPEQALRNLYKLLKSGGRLIVSTPQPELFPYKICPQNRIGEPLDKLKSEGIWPWHFKGLGENKLMPLLDKIGFEIEERKYVTYAKGYEVQKSLRKSFEEKDLRQITRNLNRITTWSLSDFGISQNRDLNYSISPYITVARKHKNYN